MCPCGCGHWKSETHGLDEDGEPRDSSEWVVVKSICRAREAMDRYLADQKQNVPGLSLYTRWRADDEDADAVDEDADAVDEDAGG